VASVSNEQEEGLHRIISPLQVDSSHERLNIAQAHLQLYSASSRVPEQNGIPRASFSPTLHDRQWHLDAIRQRRRGGTEEGGESSGMTGIAHWRARGIRPNSDREAKDGSDPVQLGESHIRTTPALDAAVSIAIDPRRCGYVLLADVERQPTFPELLTERSSLPVEGVGGDGEGANRCRHPPSLALRPSPAVNTNCADAPPEKRS